jgi:hypothetical protein
MAELLAAINDLTFDWYHKWIKLNKPGQQKNLIKNGMS